MAHHQEQDQPGLMLHCEALRMIQADPVLIERMTVDEEYRKQIAKKLS